MEFESPLIPATLIRRYKRFLADVRLECGEVVTAHCPNPGAMTGLAEPGTAIFLADKGLKGRKLRYSWALTRLAKGGLAGIDTGLPNHLAAEALARLQIPELAGYGSMRREVPYAGRSRIDLLLEAPGRPPCYVEVKNVHLMRHPGLAEFPDCVTARGAKHLEDLAAMVAAGARAVMLYIVQMDGATRFRAAEDIDPAYGKGLSAAISAGVEVLVYDTVLSLKGVTLGRPLTFLPPAAAGQKQGPAETTRRPRARRDKRL